MNHVRAGAVKNIKSATAQGNNAQGAGLVPALLKNMEHDVYQKEFAMCQKLFQKNGGKCNWGECATCGVIPLLHKLETGEIVESVEDVKELKKSILHT